MSFIAKVKSIFGSKSSCSEGCCCSASKAQSVECTCHEGAVFGDIPVEPAKLESIKVLGVGCAKCHQLNDAVVKCAKELGISTPIEYITDMSAIAAYGVMSMPALVINEKVVSYGKVLKHDEIKSIFNQYQ